MPFWPEWRRTTKELIWLVNRSFSRLRWLWACRFEDFECSRLYRAHRQNHCCQGSVQLNGVMLGLTSRLHLWSCTYDASSLVSKSFDLPAWQDFNRYRCFKGLSLSLRLPWHWFVACSIPISVDTQSEFRLRLVFLSVTFFADFQDLQSHLLDLRRITWHCFLPHLLHFQE